MHAPSLTARGSQTPSGAHNFICGKTLTTRRALVELWSSDFTTSSPHYFSPLLEVFDYKGTIISITSDRTSSPVNLKVRGPPPLDALSIPSVNRNIALTPHHRSNNLFRHIQDAVFFRPGSTTLMLQL